MKKIHLRSFLSGIVFSALTLSIVGTAAATFGSRTLTADYSDIKIEMNGKIMQPTDSNGNLVEPFAVNGTIYLPVRAVGEALGLGVSWDGERNAVILKAAVDNENQETIHLWNVHDSILSMGIKGTQIFALAGFGTTAEGLELLKNECDYYKERYTLLSEHGIETPQYAEALTHYKAVLDQYDELYEKMVTYKMSNRSSESFEEMKQAWRTFGELLDEAGQFFRAYMTENFN